MKKKNNNSKKEEKAAISEIFGSNTPVVQPEKKGKGKDRPKIEMSEEFEDYVAVKLLIKALEGVEKQLDRQFKDTEAFEYFHSELCRTQSQPSTAEGVHGRATAQFQFKKRGHGFSKEVADQLDGHQISYEKTEKIPERYTINPQILEDQELLGKLAVTIKNLGVDYDVIEKQEPVYSYQITSETASQIAKIKDNTIRAELIRSVFSLATAQAKLDGVDAKGGALEAALEILQEKGILSID